MSGEATPGLPGEQPTMFVIKFPTGDSSRWERFVTTLEPEQLQIVRGLVNTLAEIAMGQKLEPMLERRIVAADDAQKSLFRG